MANRSLVDHSAATADHPFDAVALRYDASFTNQELGRWLRRFVWDRLGEAFQPGESVIDLGCGTGEDAIWLAQLGVRVTAVDVSAAMLAVAETKAREAGVADRISFARADLGSVAVGRLDPVGGSELFDGAFSNFGPLNCVADRRLLASVLGRRIRPGGTLILVVMGPLCPWEMGWHLARGRFRTATRRLRSGATAHVGTGELPVWYPSPRRLHADFSADFDHVQTVGIGVLLPPSELGHLVSRAPRLFRTLRRLDARLGRACPGTWLNDHYLSVFRRR